MRKVPHPLKKKLSGSQAVSKCLQYDTPPATPERMRKYRKKHNQKPGSEITALVTYLWHQIIGSKHCLLPSTGDTQISHKTRKM